ncbi:hypothetical protein VPZ60_004319 [Salmonella enterica]|nr:hypothetical protein [Salmonella enterica]
MNYDKERVSVNMNTQLETPSGFVAELTKDGIIYRHYLITKHALTRYTQRVRGTVDSLFPSLDRVVVADAQQARDHRIQTHIRRSEERGGYALLDPESGVYYFLAVGANKLHTICTVMTNELLTYAGNYGIRANTAPDRSVRGRR